MTFQCARRFVHIFVLICSLLSIQPLKTATAQGTAAPWIEARQKNGIIYLLYSTPPQVKRYDMVSHTWLPDLSLPLTPTAFTISDQFIYIGFDHKIYRYSLSGQNEYILCTLQNPIVYLQNIGIFLFANVQISDDKYYTEFVTINNVTGEVHQQDHQYSPYIFDIVPSLHRIYGHLSYSSANIFENSYDPNTGEILWWDTDHYLNYFQTASRVWVIPGDQVIISDQGIVYDALYLQYKNSLETKIDDLTFNGNLPIVLRNGDIITYSSAFMKNGQYHPSLTPSNIFFNGTSVFALSSSNTGPIVQIIPLTLFQPIPRGPIDPRGMVYTVDQSFMGKGEIVYLLSKENQSIFRWDVATRRYLQSIPLVSSPDYITYASTTNRIYLMYHSGQVHEIQLDQSFQESALFTLYYEPCGIVAIEDFLYICNYGFNSTAGSYTFKPDGTKLDPGFGGGDRFGFEWNPATRHLFFISGYGPKLSNILIGADGIMLPDSTDPSTWVNHQPPYLVRVSGDGTVTLLRDSLINTNTFDQIQTNPYPSTDGVWVGTILYPFENENGIGLLEKWDSSGKILASRQVQGNPVRVFSIQEGLLAISSISGRPWFSIWNSGDLSPIAIPPVAEYSSSVHSDENGFKATFSNKTQGNWDKAQWVFGDGGTSTSPDPIHIYTKGSDYNVKLVVSGPGGEDAIIHSLSVYSKIFMPIISTRFYVKSGLYTMNKCVTFDVIRNILLAHITQCVPSILVNSDGTAQFNFSWTVEMIPGPVSCLDKGNDILNPKMYVKDSAGVKYTMITGGGDAAAGIQCAQSGLTYSGWFLFPSANSTATTFTFYDDDNGVTIGPLALPLN